MREVRLLLKLAKIVRTPQDAAVIFLACGALILLAYLIPANTAKKQTP